MDRTIPPPPRDPVAGPCGCTFDALQQCRVVLVLCDEAKGLLDMANQPDAQGMPSFRDQWWGFYCEHLNAARVGLPGWHSRAQEKEHVG